MVIVTPGFLTVRHHFENDLQALLERNHTAKDGIVTGTVHILSCSSIKIFEVPLYPMYAF